MTFYDLDGRETVINEKTGSKPNSQQESVSSTSQTPTFNDKNEIERLTTKTSSLTQNENGSFTLRSSESILTYDNGEVTGVEVNTLSETVDSFENLSEAGQEIAKQLINQQNEINYKENILPNLRISKNTNPDGIKFTGKKMPEPIDLSIANQTNTIVGLVGSGVDLAAKASQKDIISDAKKLGERGMRLFDKEKEAFKFLGKVSKFTKGLGAATGALQAGFALAKIIDDEDNNRGADPWDYVDAIAGGIAFTAGMILLFGTPVGWAALTLSVAVAATTAYSAGRLIQDIATD
jgi:hypothetical protein